MITAFVGEIMYKSTWQVVEDAEIVHDEPLCGICPKPVESMEYAKLCGGLVLWDPLLLSSSVTVTLGVAKAAIPELSLRVGASGSTVPKAYVPLAEEFENGLPD